MKGSAEFTGDADRLERFVDSLEAWGGTALYDAVHYGLTRVKDQPGRKAVIVFSDGADHNSTMTEQEVIDYARSVEATVYSILIRGEQGMLGAQPARLPAQDRPGDGRVLLLPGQGGRAAEGLLRASPTSCTSTTRWPTRRARTPTAPGARSRSGCVSRKDAEVRVRKGYFAVKRRKTSTAPPTRPPCPRSPWPRSARNGARERFPLTKDRVTIGRSRESDIFLPDQWLSRHHAEIRRDGDEFFVVRPRAARTAPS